MSTEKVEYKKKLVKRAYNNAYNFATGRSLVRLLDNQFYNLSCVKCGEEVKRKNNISKPVCFSCKEKRKYIIK